MWIEELQELDFTILSVRKLDEIRIVQSRCHATFCAESEKKACDVFEILCKQTPALTFRSRVWTAGARTIDGVLLTKVSLATGCLAVCELTLQCCSAGPA